MLCRAKSTPLLRFCFYQGKRQLVEMQREQSSGGAEPGEHIQRIRENALAVYNGSLAAFGVLRLLNVVYAEMRGQVYGKEGTR